MYKKTETGKDEISADVLSGSHAGRDAHSSKCADLADFCLNGTTELSCAALTSSIFNIYKPISLFQHDLYPDGLAKAHESRLQNVGEK